MDCRESKRLLKRYIEGELDAAQLAALERHCLKCRDCSGEFAAVRRLADLVEHAMAPQMRAEEMSERVADALADTPAAVLGSGGARRRFMRGTGAAIAAGALIVAAFFAGRASHGTPPAPEGEPLAIGIDRLEGTVLVRRDGAGQWVPLVGDTPLYLADTIQTLPKGTIVLSLGPDSDIEIGPGSTLVLKSFNGKAELFLDYGSMTAALEGQHAPFYVSTPDGRIRALGTVFRVCVE